MVSDVSSGQDPVQRQTSMIVCYDSSPPSDGANACSPGIRSYEGSDHGVDGRMW